MEQSKRNRWILWGLIIALVLGCLLWMFWPKPQGLQRIASVWVNGSTVLEFDLNTTEDDVISLEEYVHHPVSLEVKSGAVRFLESDCPDKICVNTGFLREDGDLASCLPNKVIVTIETRE
ncbi:MAG: NusG domain II-containing protein [Angelakisella sp.]|nr:NusG domain II-containing protein [Angelakisella sp.]